MICLGRSHLCFAATNLLSTATGIVDDYSLYVSYKALVGCGYLFGDIINL